jgi:tripartite ATP-independent transporter DctM subunit
MSPIIIGLIGILLVLLLLICGVPIGFSMILVGSLGFAYLVNIPASLQVVGVSSYGIISSYDWLVLPLFILMGCVFARAGLGQSLFKLAYNFIGRLPGGLSIAAIGACAIFSAVSASSLATAVTIGVTAIPQMRKYKYDSGLAAGCCAAGGTLGILIPPSTIFIVYGILTETSIAELFIAGILPGVILSLMFMGMILIRAQLNPTIAPPGQRTSSREKLEAVGGCAEVIVFVVFVLGGLIVGWFTPTEAGGIAAFGAIVISLARKRLGWQSFKDSLWDTVRNTGMIFVCLIGAFILTPFIAVSRIPMELSGLVANLGFPSTAVIGLIILTYFVLGCFIDTMAMILLTLPVFFPLVTGLGYDPIWFGVIVVLVVEMALVTPPVGMNVYVISGIAKDVPMEHIFRGIFPFVVVELAFLIILVAFPQIALFLPGLLK